MTEISFKNPIAYFCAEYGIESDLPLYAGGLGVLAGDTVKEAADQNLPFVAVGLLYRGEKAIQAIDENGMQTEVDKEVDPLSMGFEHIYVDETPLFIKVHLTEIDVWARCWKKTIKNNVVLYLLDTETDQNLKQERDIAHALYVGTEE
jgi:starch phosphorylase